MSNEQSYIGLDIESVSQISNIPADVSNLRIIHCNNLTTLKSIELYKNLTSLDSSSNQISALDGLEKLVLLKELNLSCNDIEVLMSFEKLTNLVKVNLSHNRIKSLKGFQKVASNHVLESVYFEDNLIQDFNELQYLANAPHIKQIVFKKKTSDNPICRKSDYCNIVLKYLPQLLNLDENEVSNNEQPNVLIPRENYMPKREENKEKVMVRQSKHYPANTHIHPNEEEIANTKQRIFELEKQINEIENEKKSFKVEFRKIVQKTKDDAIVIDSLQKRLKENDRAINSKEDYNKKLNYDTDSLKMALANLQKSYDLQLSTISQQSSAMETLRQANLQLENDIKTLHQKSVKSSDEALKAYQSIEDQLKKAEADRSNSDISHLNEIKQWESKSNKVQELFKEEENKNKELLQKIEELTSINKQLEFSYNQKTQELFKSLDQTKSNSQHQLNESVSKFKEIMANQQRKLNAKKEEELKEIKDKHQQEIDSLAQKQKEATNENNELKLKLGDLKNLLKASVQREAKSENTINELRDVITHAAHDVKNEREQSLKMRKTYEEVLNGYQTQMEQLKKGRTQLQADYDAVTDKLGKLNDSLKEKSSTDSILNQQLIETSSKLKQCENSLSLLKEKEESVLRQESKLRAENEELKIEVTAKTKMLDSQNQDIDSMKDTIKSMENEMSEFKNGKNEYKEMYEEKLKAEIENNDKIKSRNSELEQRINELENDCSTFKENETQLLASIDGLKQQISEKDNILGLVEKEVSSIQAQRNEDKILINEKEKKIASLDNTITTQSKSYREAISNLKQEIQTQINAKQVCENELITVKQKLKETESEIKVLVIEMEKRKKAAQEKLQQMTQLFKD